VVNPEFRQQVATKLDERVRWLEDNNVADFSALISSMFARLAYAVKPYLTQSLAGILASCPLKRADRRLRPCGGRTSSRCPISMNRLDAVDWSLKQLILRARFSTGQIGTQRAG